MREQIWHVVQGGRFVTTAACDLIGMEPGDAVRIPESQDIFAGECDAQDSPFGCIAALFVAMSLYPKTRFTLYTADVLEFDRFHASIGESGDPGGVLLGAASTSSILRFFEDEALCMAANYINGIAALGVNDDGNPLDGSAKRWPLPNVFVKQRQSN